MSEKCPHCGSFHQGSKCPLIKSVEYYESGEIKKIEYFEADLFIPGNNTVYAGGAGAGPGGLTFPSGGGIGGYSGGQSVLSNAGGSPIHPSKTFDTINSTDGTGGGKPMSDEEFFKSLVENNLFIVPKKDLTKT